jgi:hypothetical protein
LEKPENPNNSWLYRYNRTGYVKKYYLDEDQEIFNEHIENIARKSGK